MGEKRGEVGIGVLIVNDKAGIDRRLAHHHRMAVAADAPIALEQGYTMALRQQPRRRQAGNTAANDGDIEGSFLPHRPC
jgi:hypothetical protein